MAKDVLTPPPLVLRDLATDEARAAEAFALAHPDGQPFHSPRWKAAIEEAFGLPCFWRTAFRGEEIVGLCPLVKAPAPFGGANLVSTAFAVGGGILAHDDEARLALALDAEVLGRRLKVGAVELRSEKALLPGWGVKEGVYAMFRKAMPADAEARLLAIPRKKRADVRKAIAAAPRVEVGASVRDFHRIYAESLHGLGTPVHGLRWPEALARAFGGDCEISLVHGPAGPVAALMSFYFGGRVLPYFGGAKPEARALHAYDYMYWAQMERAAARGAHVFDFGRSKFGTGAFDYKSHWGFEPTPQAHQYRLITAREAPDVNPTSPKYRRFVALWKRLPLWAANRLGPILARRLG